MSLLNPRLLIVGGLALLGCATARPLFEQEFIDGSPTALHDAWMRTLQSRYGCDTMILHVRLINVFPLPSRAYRPIARPNGDEPIWAVPTSSGGFSGGGAIPTPCDYAGLPPTVVRVWATRDGIREDWMYARVVRYRFRGTDSLNLRASPDLSP